MNQIKVAELTKKEKIYALKIKIGLQAVDGLETSEYLSYTAARNINGEISFEEASALLKEYYEQKSNRDINNRVEEADNVSLRIAIILSEHSFSFTPNEYLAFHRRLFEGIYPHAGCFRNYNITKKRMGINETTEYLETFLRNLLLNENHPLHNCALHISGKFNNVNEKANIDSEKVNIQSKKVNIGKDMANKTALHIQKLREIFGSEQIFGRSDIQRVLGLKQHDVVSYLTC